MNRVVFGGTTQPGCTPIAPSSPAYDPTVRCTRFDVADAKKLVARSGVSNPTVHLMVLNNTRELLIAQFIQASEAAVGINVVIEPVDIATRGSRSMAGNFDTMLNGPVGAPDPDFNYTWLNSAGSRNYGGYSSPRLDLVLANARKATSPAALKTLYHAAEEIIASDRPVIILYHAVRFTGISSGVDGVRVFPDLQPHVEFAQYR